ncbi:MAG: ECF transporter S component [Lachnospiraceae bacterium]|nr:ECF transporter S component [Lachnospiraceae bacterium]
MKLFFADEHAHESLIQIAKENLSFILVILLVTAIVILLANLCEQYVLKKTGQKSQGWNAKKIAGIGVFSAIGGVLTMIEFPLPFVPGFYMLDFSEVSGMIAAFLLGPVAGVLVEFLKTLIHVLLHGTHTAFVGDFAMFAMGSVYVLPAALFYLVKKSRKRALLGLLMSALALVVFGAFFNGFYLIPTFAKLYGMDLDAIISMGTAITPLIKNMPTFIAFATVPFNLIKGIAVGAAVFLIYKPLSNLYRKLG